MPTKLTSEIIAAAIEGFESQKRHIDGQIAELRQMLDGGPKLIATPEAPARKRRKFSAATRRRMKEAQQRRWAAIKGDSARAQAKTEAPKPKRKLSEAGRKAIIAATKKRWALIKAKGEKSKPASAKTTAR